MFVFNYPSVQWGIRAQECKAIVDADMLTIADIEAPSTNSWLLLPISYTRCPPVGGSAPPNPKILMGNTAQTHCNIVATILYGRIRFFLSHIYIFSFLKKTKKQTMDWLFRPVRTIADLRSCTKEIYQSSFQAILQCLEKCYKALSA